MPQQPGDCKTESQAENAGGFQGDKLMMKRDETQYEKDVTIGYFWDLLGAQKKLKCQRYQKGTHRERRKPRQRQWSIG